MLGRTSCVSQKGQIAQSGKPILMDLNLLQQCASRSSLQLGEDTLAPNPLDWFQSTYLGPRQIPPMSPVLGHHASTSPHEWFSLICPSKTSQVSWITYARRLGWIKTRTRDSGIEGAKIVRPKGGGWDIDESKGRPLQTLANSRLTKCGNGKTVIQWMLDQPLTQTDPISNNKG